MDQKRKSASASVAKLITMGLCSESMHPVYIRPIIMYAMENFNLNGGEIRKFKLKLFKVETFFAYVPSLA